VNSDVEDTEAMDGRNKRPSKWVIGERLKSEGKKDMGR